MAIVRVDETARELVRMFQENFVKYEEHVDAAHFDEKIWARP